MITLTDTDVVRLLRKNNLNSDTLQENVVAKLREKGVKLATAESCTGGLLSERITAVSGASDVFDFGVCTYANEMKHKVLGVSNETLSVLGAVSAETAMQMAEGARKCFGCGFSRKTQRELQVLRAELPKSLSVLFIAESAQKTKVMQ